MMEISGMGEISGMSGMIGMVRMSGMSVHTSSVITFQKHKLKLIYLMMVIL